MATDFNSAEGDSMNLEELKRKIDEFQDATRSYAIHGDMEAYAEEVEATKDALLTAIVAKLETAQRLRDAAAEMVKRVNANQSPEGLLTSDQWKPVAWLALHRAVAAFDKEQQ